MDSAIALDRRSAAAGIIICFGYTETAPSHILRLVRVSLVPYREKKIQSCLQRLKQIISCFNKKCAARIWSCRPI